MSDLPFSYVHSAVLPDLMERLNLSVLVSTYQAGKLIAVRARQQRLSTLVRTFDEATGIAVQPDRIAIATRRQIWLLRNASDIASQIEPLNEHDACFVPRSSHVTGDIRCHDIAWAVDELWFVNTRFSCLCTLNADYSFVPRWHPPFVHKLAAEDRCHLNGLAIQEGEPKYVTALGETDTPDGWRSSKATGGVVIDVPSGEIIARGLSMPHSPRLYNGRLWMLDSGRGRLIVLDPVNGTQETVAELPGFTRGLTFHGRYAFVGLSKIREMSTFGGLPLAQQQVDLKCGVAVVDIETGQTVAILEFQRGIEEIFDVQILPGIRFPAIVGFQQDTIDGVFVVPRGAL